MASRVFISREFGGQSSFGTFDIKFANSSDAMPAWSVHRLFALEGFPTFVGHISPHRFARNFDHIVKLKFFFFTFQSCKKRSSTPWGFLGLSSNIFTFDYLFTHRSDVFNNSATSLTKWPEYRKNRFLSSSINSVRVHFRERVEKTKENGKNTTLENLQNGQEKYGGKKLAYGHIWSKNLNCHISSNVSLKLLWTVI